MRYRLVGRTGLRVSELALGTMTFGNAWGWGASEDESRRIFEAFVEQGGNFVDTACNYTDGQSEELVGAFVGSDRDRFVVATKYTLTSRADDPNAGGNHRKKHDPFRRGEPPAPSYRPRGHPVPAHVGRNDVR